MFQRHQLIYINSDSSFSIKSCHRDIDTLSKHVVEWFKKGLPCVCARQSTDDGYVKLGLPLYVGKEKHRVALVVNSSSIIKQQPLPKLIEMQDFFFKFYGIEGLDALIRTQQVMKISVYGSFLFHYLSGQFIVDEKSDLDLLIDYSEFTLDALNELIQAINKLFNRTIDGEVRFHQLGDVSLHELLDDSTKNVLYKHPVGVELLLRDELYERYPSLCCV